MKRQKKIREIKSLIEKRFNYYESNEFDIRIVPLPANALRAARQAENIKAKLLQGTQVRLVVCQTLNNVKKTNIAKGVEVVISGKVRGQGAKAQKYKWVFLLTTGQPKLDFIDEAIWYVEMRQWVLYIKVKILWDNQGSKKEICFHIMLKSINLSKINSRMYKEEVPTQLSNNHYLLI